MSFVSKKQACMSFVSETPQTQAAYLLDLSTMESIGCFHDISSMLTSIKVFNSGVASANGLFLPQPPSTIPQGFAKVCVKSRWDTNQMWEQLTDLRTTWYLKDDDAYIYFNRGDGKWWLDAPEGHGLYVTQAKVEDGKVADVPPAGGWQSLGDYGATPEFDFIKHAAKKDGL
jgi:hypothetical protein